MNKYAPKSFLEEWEDANEWHQEDEEIDPHEGQKQLHRIFSCSSATEDTNDPWWDSEDFFESEEESILSEMQKRHDESCACGNPIDMLVPNNS